mgnify:CR=1 FL=1
MNALPLADRVAAVVVAAGRGTRIGDPDKVLVPLAGWPMLAWSLAAIEQTDVIGAVIVVVGAHTRIAISHLVRDEGFSKVRAIVDGGERRQDSVAAGLDALPQQTDIVVIHDAARPLATPELFTRAARAAAEFGAAIAATPVADTLKRVDEDTIVETVDRTGLWAAQTPQAFRLEVLRAAMAAGAGETITDEARLCEAASIPVTIVQSSLANLKVTLPDDVAVAEALLRAREDQPHAAPAEGWRTGNMIPRVGIGYDAHRFASGRRLVLGGVELAHDRGLEGHSDADVLLHAIADALLGAAALGDIGQHFPPSDERHRDADSRDLLREAVRLVRVAGWAPANVDATVLAEAPRISPHVPQMRERIAEILGVSVDAVGIKATTNEGMGAIGRGEGIAALATATLVPVPAS